MSQECVSDPPGATPLAQRTWTMSDGRSRVVAGGVWTGGREWWAILDSNQ